ncbi:MAG: CueP family metal-binding protein [Erysipelotrichaceae bacterium]|jgi:hypothetical protein
MMKNRLIVITVLGIVFVSVAISFFALPRGASKVLNQLGLEKTEIKEVVNILDQRIDEPTNVGARITGDKLFLYDNEKEYSLDLPTDSFFVSIAPYINEVHPCTIHNLVSCRGEIFNQTMRIRIIDENNQIIIDEERTTQDNGFIGIWLPKGINATLNVEYDGLTVEYPISTFSESDTCITTPLKLEPIKF